MARALRDSGYEVIYTGIRQTPESIVKTATQEDVDFLGLSLLSGAYKELFTKVVEILKENGAGDIIVFGGGTHTCRRYTVSERKRCQGGVHTGHPHQRDC